MLNEKIVPSCGQVHCTEPLYMGKCKPICWERYRKMIGIEDSVDIKLSEMESLCEKLLVDIKQIRKGR